MGVDTIRIISIILVVILLSAFLFCYASADLVIAEKTFNSTIIIPDKVDSMIIYFHSHCNFPHSNGRTPRSPYNFQEDIAHSISISNPSSIVVVAKYDGEDLLERICELILQYKPSNIVFSGWSAGGSDAIVAASYYLSRKVPVCSDTHILLIDANHTNEVKIADIDTIAYYGVDIYYTTYVMSKSKMRVLSNIISREIPIVFWMLDIPDGFRGSPHIHCRNAAFDFELYSCILSETDPPDNYTSGGYDYEVGDAVFGE